MSNVKILGDSIRMSRNFHYLPKKLLREVNDAAIREKRNRYLETKWIDSLDEEFMAIVDSAIYHKKMRLG